MLTGWILAAGLSFTASMAHHVDDLARAIVTQKRAPGLAIGIVEEGRIVYAQGFGYSDRGHHVRFTPQTQMPVGAVSMQFTSAALLLLEQGAKLTLDDPVAKFVPELTVAKDVTIRELLNHTSGLPDPTVSGDHSHTVKLADLIAAANKLAPFAPAGTQYRDNPFDAMIAGSIVERVSGVDLSDYLQEHVFLPLVMDNTLLAGDTGIAPSHAIGYTGRAGALRRAAAWDPAWLYGEGIVTNVYDLAKWDIGLPLLLRIPAEREMFTAATTNGPERPGLGWFIDSRGDRPYYWQDGELPGFAAMNGMLPQDHVAVIVLTNVDDMNGAGTALPEDLASHILDIVLPPPHVGFDSAIVTRAKEWLARIAEKNIDRTQLTPAFSAYLTDDLLARANFAALGKPLAFVPLSSAATNDGGTLYEFLVRFAHAQYTYRFGVAKDGKIDQLFLAR
jgi:D-alanyl-D-alanine carboxypeptidase